jgi:ribosomal-protein-alanine N-acetyltransferase
MSRVTVRPVTAADKDAVVTANRDSRDYHRPWVESFQDEAGFDDWLKRSGEEDFVGLLALERETGAVVGVINISVIVRRGFQSAFTGFYAMRGTAGRGLMTEAVDGAVRYAFDELGLHRLEANIQPGNARSKALVQRVGFRLEGFSPRYLKIGGEWRDHERWAICSDDP